MVHLERQVTQPCEITPSNHRRILDVAALNVPTNLRDFSSYILFHFRFGIFEVATFGTSSNENLEASYTCTLLHCLLILSMFL